MDAEDRLDSEDGDSEDGDSEDPIDSEGSRPWLAWSVGDRVVVRYRIERERAGGPGHTDALGYLLACGPDGVTVRTRTGDVTIPAAAIALGKRVPPPPARRR